MLAPEYGWNADRVIVSRGDDAALGIECCNESAKRRRVDQGLIGESHDYTVARIVRKECRKSGHKRRSEPFCPIGIYFYRHRFEPRQRWRNCSCSRAENYHHSTGASVESCNRGPPHQRLSVMDDQLLWEAESR